MNIVENNDRCSLPIFVIKNKIFNQVNIAGIGVYIPPFRISTAEIAQAWGKDGRAIADSLGITAKSVADNDEDSVTMAAAAAQMAFKQTKLAKNKIGAVFVGSESHAYAVKPTGSMVAQWLGIDPEYFCADLEFACKAGTAGLQIVAAMLEADLIEAGLVIGVDKAQAKPGDALEYAAASAAVAVILTKSEGFAKVQATNSFSSDTPDFWRRQTQDFPQHAGRFSGEPAYFRHIEQATLGLLRKIDKKISDFDQVVLHMPNAKFPKKMAQKLGVTTEQLANSLTVEKIGNPYSASSMLGLAQVFSRAKKGENILLSSYGSGSGSDSFWLTVNNKPPANLVKNLKQQLDKTIEINYWQYLQKMEILTD